MKKEAFWKIGAVVLVLCLSAVVISATQPEVQLMTHERHVGHKEAKPLLSVDKLAEAESLLSYNIKGNWGIYDTYKLGSFKALKRGNEIFGSARYLLTDIVFYLSLDEKGSFSGLVSFDGVSSIKGEYIYKDDNFVAIWDMADQDGWFAGTWA